MRHDIYLVMASSRCLSELIEGRDVRPEVLHGIVFCAVNESSSG